MIFREVLNNDTKILMETVSHTGTVSIGFWFLHGSRDESENEHGICHFLEHMLFKGTETLSSLQIAQNIDRVGGVINAFTEKEQTCLYCTIPSEHVELAINMLSEMAFRSILPKDEIIREKKVILNEIAEIEDMPEELGYERFLENIWGGHPLAKRITGTPSSVQRFHRKNLLPFYSKWFVPENLILSIAGNIEKRKVLDTLEEVLPSKNRESGIQSVIDGRTHPERKQSCEYKSSHFQQVQLLAGTAYPLPDKIDDFYRFLVFSTLFGESMSSRLFQGIRENTGLCYSIQAIRTYFSTTALWNVYANTSAEQLDKLISSINKEFQGLKISPPGKGEIEDAVSHLSGGLIMSLEDMEFRMKRLVRHFLLSGEVYNAEESIRLLNAVNRDHVLEVIQKYMNSTDFNLLVFGTMNLHKRKKINLEF